MQNKWSGVLVILMVLALCSPAIAKKGGGKPGGGGGDPEPPGRPAIAYVQLESGAWNLKVMNADGTNQTLLVPGVHSMSEPCGSPSGTTVLFEADDASLGYGLYTVPADGSASPTRILSTLNLMNGAEWSPVVTPNGSHMIAFRDTVSYSNRSDIYVVKPDGTGLLNLTATMSGGAQLTQIDPTWSRDGTKLIVVRGTVSSAGAPIVRELVEYTLGVDSGSGLLAIQSERNLAQSALAGARIFSPTYGRADDTVLVSVYEYVNSRDNYDLWEIDLDAPTTPTRLTNTTSAVTRNITLQEEHPDYSPSDGVMVFRVRGKSGRDGGIFLANVGANTTRTKLIGSADVRDPAWKP